MVYYGPWNAGIIQTQTLTVQGPTTYAEPAPNGGSGWALDAVGAGFSATGSASAHYPGGLTDDVQPQPAPSAEAFAAAMGALTNGDEGNTAPELVYSGSIGPSGPGVWSQSESWVARGAFYRLKYGSPWQTDWVDPTYQAVLPERPADAYSFELEFLGHANSRVTLLSATVAGTGDPNWRLVVKQPGDTSPWLQNTPAAPGIYAETESDPTIDLAGLRSLVDTDTALGAPSVDLSANDPRWPALAVVYVGPWPGDYGGPANVYTYDGPLGSVTLTYRGPRWRWVYETPPEVETVPYRRTYPRDDALAGGAGRNFPRPRSVQSSNRIGGGYL